MPPLLQDLTEQLITAAQKAGADAADAIAVNGTSVSIGVRNGDLETAERSEGIEIGVRVILGQKQACVSASDTSARAIADMAERAVIMAGHAPDDPYIRQADPGMFSTNTDARFLDMYDPAPEPSADNLKDLAAQAEAAALTHQGISQVGSATAGYGARHIHMMTSQGFSGGYARTDNALSCLAIAGTGLDMQRDYDGDYRVYHSDMRSAQDIGNSAAERALSMVGARKPPTGAYPVLFDERVSSSLIAHLLGAANGAAVARGGTWLRDALGAQVLPKGLDLFETPHRPRVTGSKPFDGEGLPTAPRHIVKDGMLQGWTLDLSTAAQLGMTSTASASRGTSSPPSPANGNMALTQGPQSRDDLLRDMGTGLLLTSLMGSSINATTGDYSRGASGFWVENGEIQYPVQEGTIAGNLRDMLKTIVPANDARPHLSRVIPSMLVEGLTLAGA
ncbi:MAG: metallopeptidase TldD-related protein [Pseudomonadota bacterium]